MSSDNSMTIVLRQGENVFKFDHRWTRADEEDCRIDTETRLYHIFRDFLRSLKETRCNAS